MKKIFYILISLSICSCSSNKSLTIVKIPKETNLVKAKAVTTAGNRTYDLMVHQTTEQVDASITLEDNKIIIKVFDSSKIQLKETVNSNLDLDIEDEFDYSLTYDLMYKGTLENNIVDNSLLYDLHPYNGNEYLIGEKFNYKSSESITQALTVPFKFRGAMNHIPYEVTTGVNVGIGYGIKWKWSSLKPIYHKNQKKMVAYVDDDFSFALLPFAGFTTIKQTPSNTNNNIESDRTIIGLNYGVSALTQFNKLTIGVAYGFDKGLGEGVIYWLYQDKNWIGLIVGLEILK